VLDLSPALSGAPGSGTSFVSGKGTGKGETEEDEEEEEGNDIDDEGRGGGCGLRADGAVVAGGVEAAGTSSGSVKDALVMDNQSTNVCVI
jgi:hypothetical protein